MKKNYVKLVRHIPVILSLRDEVLSRMVKDKVYAVNVATFL